MKINEAINFLEKQIVDSSNGLPEEIFIFISRLTPLVNVDLLIKDENGKTLLAWRNDRCHGSGWHIPGGIIRFKEKFEKRIEKVAETEIGTIVKFDQEPIAITQFVQAQNTRGHFISFLYKCFLSKHYVLPNKSLKETDNGYLKWHDSCPVNIIKCHEVYKKFINGEFNYGNK